MAAPATAEPAWPEDALEVGRIGDAWGVKGWFKVAAYAPQPEVLLSARRWYLQPPHDAIASRLARVPPVISVREARTHGDSLVASARDIDDRAAAEALRGARIFIGRSAFPTPQADEFYWADLIGLDVVNREGAHLGAVIGLIDTGAQSVLRVLPAEVGQAKDDDRQTERMIPFVSAYVDAVDLPARRISVDWGLDF